MCRKKHERLGRNYQFSIHHPRRQSHPNAFHHCHLASRSEVSLSCRNSIPVAEAKIFRRQVWDNPRLIVSTCMLCEQVAASADLRLLSLVRRSTSAARRTTHPTPRWPSDTRLPIAPAAVSVGAVEVALDPGVTQLIASCVNHPVPSI